ncbi:asparagine synthetase domain-containing protein 1-like isoform X2 [Rhopilema esculentum]|uniref:asparagine synthetase domain-containing protein 1-like isoform X2 n=1 Tax=Rhopilema esculentum TaxID=499914 RepID=UPI0031E2367C
MLFPCSVQYCALFSSLSSVSGVEVLCGKSVCRLSNRGPDAVGNFKEILNKFQNGSYKLEMEFAGYVLHLRGCLTVQPLKDRAGNILLWNGEIFGGDIKVENDENDGEKLLEVLSSIQAQCNEEKNAEYMMKIFGNIHGPWAFVYWQKNQGLLWFGRDYFGRRSLLWHFPKSASDQFILSSVAHDSDKMDFTEIPAKMLYCIKMKDVLDFWNPTDELIGSSGNKFEQCIKALSMQVPRSDHGLRNMLLEKSVCNCLSPKKESTENAKFDTENCLSTEKNVFKEGSDEKVGACENSSVADKESMYEPVNTDLLCKLCSCIHLKPYTEPPAKETSENAMMLEKCASFFLEVMEEATRRRVYNLPREKFLELKNKEGILDSLQTIDTKEGKQVTNVGILFSGGIDSMVLAALADRCIPKNEVIDLFNVAFEQRVNQQNLNAHKKNPKESEKKEPYDVPDRITGKSGVCELNPKRRWNFIEINVTLEELKSAREEHVKHLVYPLATVLDDSIGCAIWFAARGRGARFVLDNGKLVKKVEDYTSNAKVLLTGMGADEQLGGYARHRSKFEKFGWEGLKEEIEMEIDRISSRNLGRDDRCISDHGREARFPFLDENVVAFLKRVPIWIKCDPRLPRGHGEKRLLREMARKLNLHGAAVLPKRAIQFGSKIAKIENSKEKGSDTCNRLQERDQQTTKKTFLTEIFKYF